MSRSKGPRMQGLTLGRNRRKMVQMRTFQPRKRGEKRQKRHPVSYMWRNMKIGPRGSFWREIKLIGFSKNL